MRIALVRCRWWGIGRVVGAGAGAVVESGPGAGMFTGEVGTTVLVWPLIV